MAEVRNYREDNIDYTIQIERSSNGMMTFHYVGTEKFRDGKEWTTAIRAKGVLKRMPRGTDGDKWFELVNNEWYPVSHVPGVIRQCWMHHYQEPSKEGRIRKAAKTYTDTESVEEWLTRAGRKRPVLQ